MKNNKLTARQCGICAECEPQINGGSGFNNCAEAHAAQLAAVETLRGLGYAWNGGQLWKPPIGLPPSYINNDRAELDAYRKASKEPVAEVVAWSHSEKTGRNCDVRLLQFNLKPGLLYAGPALPTLCIPPVSKGVDHYSQGWNACRTAMIQRLTEDVVTKKQ